MKNAGVPVLATAKVPLNQADVEASTGRAEPSKQSDRPGANNQKLRLFNKASEGRCRRHEQSSSQGTRQGPEPEGRAEPHSEAKPRAGKYRATLLLDAASARRAQTLHPAGRPVHRSARVRRLLAEGYGSNSQAARPGRLLLSHWQHDVRG